LNFFSLDESQKSKFSLPPVLGYSRVNHKQSYRIITGKTIHPMRYPPQFRELLKDLSEDMDEVVHKLGMIILEAMGVTYESKYDIPLMERSEINHPVLKKQFNYNNFGMLDIAYYDNEVTEEKDNTYPPLNCAEHTDPGLVSLNVGSTAPGLQFFDPVNNNWVDIPAEEGVGVIWCGDAVVYMKNEGERMKLMAGKHRVQYDDKPRTTMWHEAILRGQYEQLFEHPIFEKLILNEIETGIPPSKVYIPPKYDDFYQKYDEKDDGTYLEKSRCEIL